MNFRAQVKHCLKQYLSDHSGFRHAFSIDYPATMVANVSWTATLARNGARSFLVAIKTAPTKQLLIILHTSEIVAVIKCSMRESWTFTADVEASAPERCFILSSSLLQVDPGPSLEAVTKQGMREPHIKATIKKLHVSKHGGSEIHRNLLEAINGNLPIYV